MPRKPLIRTDSFAYHVYARTNNKEPFPIPLDQVWRTALKYFEKTYNMFNHHIFSFVLMPNHFHILLRTPERNLDVIMHYWMREVSKKISFSAGRINHIFGGPYKWCLIDNEIYYSNIYRYIYRNPVEANLCEKVEDYPFSTLQYLLNSKLKPYFYLFDHEYTQLSGTIPHKLGEKFAWLNTTFSEKQNILIKKGLNRRIFNYSTNSSFRKERSFLIGNSSII